MPGLNLRARGQRVGPLGTIRTFVSVLREMSFDQVREEAELVPRLLILAPDEETAGRLGEALTGPEGTKAVTAKALDAQLRELGRFDAVVVLDPERTGAAARARERLPTDDGPSPVFSYDGTRPDDAGALETLRALIAHRLPDRTPAFGRAFPVWRAAAAKAVVDETAKANAQFALISNIPAVIPLVGSLASAGADFLVLTKNQLMMLFKVAAIHGRDLHDQWGLMREMVPVVGAGLFWRTIAREAASFIPLAAGTIPKVVIAYAGTLSAGRAADFYYRTGHQASRDQVEGFYRQAAEAVKKLPLPIPGQNGERPSGDGAKLGRNVEGSEDGKPPVARETVGGAAERGEESPSTA